MHPVIQITNLKKTYQNGNEKNQVLKGINLNINPGQIIGYIGPNGAGKSTTVKIMCGLLDSFSGEVLVNGTDIKKDPVKIKSQLKHFEIENTAHQRVGSFSKGMKQKVLIISALLHEPEILFMDEPLSGLDANAVIKVKEMITQMANEGKTIFYSSHLMDIVEKVSNRIILINEGNIIADGTFDELKAANHDESLEKMFARLTGHEQTNAFNLTATEN
jgi:ABC-2 type transport system ATP-binding protein